MQHRNLHPTLNEAPVNRARIDLREGRDGAPPNELPIASDELQKSLVRLFEPTVASTHHSITEIETHRESLQALLRKLLGVDDRLTRIETLVTELHQLAKNATPAKDWYSVHETSEILGRAEFTVREWCRLGRVHAAKRECGRGHSQEWIVSHEELLRIQNEGLLSQ